MRLAVYGSKSRPNLATGYHNIGLMYKNQGKYPEVLATLEKALKVQLAIHGAKLHPGLAVICNNVGYLHWERKSYRRAEECYSEACTIQKACFGETYQSTRRTLKDLNEAHKKQGKRPIASSVNYSDVDEKMMH